MKSFPSKLTPKNIKLFKEYLFNRNLCYLRKKIYEYMLSEEKTGFSLVESFSGGEFSYKSIDERLVMKIREELEALGWKITIAYGGTTLFIYEEESDLPANISDSSNIFETMI